jgi:dihydroorotase
MKIIRVEALANVHSHIRQGPVKAHLIQKLIDGGCDIILPMPNTDPELTTAEMVNSYIEESKTFLPARSTVQFIPTVMITEKTSPGMIEDCVEAGIKNAKIYPKNRTTKSENGVVNYINTIPAIRAAGRFGMRCHMHPENPWMRFGNREAEYQFLEIARMLLEETSATLIWEHGTDSRCIPFWVEMAKTKRFYVTLTAHHLATTEDKTFGDVRATCKPPIKTEADRTQLVELVGKGYDWVMAGPDDAPHDVLKKHVHEGQCSCGAYTAPFLLPLYAHTLEHLFKTREGVEVFIEFTSRNARKLHGLPATSKLVSLINQAFKIPPVYSLGPWTVEPFWAGQTINWSIE